MNSELLQAIQQIPRELSQPSNWDIAGVIIGGIGVILTIVVLWYNHKSIKLAQHSIQQAIGLQLYEKWLELYSALAEDTAFEEIPMSLKIVYSEEIYNLYAEISNLCRKRSQNILELYVLRRESQLCSIPCWNVCEPMFQKYLKDVDDTIKKLPTKEETLIVHKAGSQARHQKICHQYIELESKRQSIRKGSVES